MMQAIEQEMRSLRRRIFRWLERIGWPQGAEAAASARLARELGLPNEAVSRILERTASDLRKLSENESDEIDARPIIERAVNELSKLGFQARPFEEAAMERYLQELPERDYQILRYFKLGKKHREIAELMETDIESVRASLVKTYADLRLRMISSDPEGGGQPTRRDAPYSNTFAKQPLEQPSLHRN